MENQLTKFILKIKNPLKNVVQFVCNKKYCEKIEDNDENYFKFNCNIAGFIFFYFF